MTVLLLGIGGVGSGCAPADSPTSGGSGASAEAGGMSGSGGIQQPSAGGSLSGGAGNLTGGASGSGGAVAGTGGAGNGGAGGNGASGGAPVEGGAAAGSNGSAGAAGGAPNGVVMGGPDGYQKFSSFSAPPEATRKPDVPRATLDTFVYTSPPFSALANPAPSPETSLSLSPLSTCPTQKSPSSFCTTAMSN